MMSEAEPEEYVPGFTVCLSETGLEGDVLNGGWVPNSMNSALGDFDRLKPVPHYHEYFAKQDQVYKDAGKPGLLNAVMQHSNPDAVAALDRVADEFNADLPRIREERDDAAVQKFLAKVRELRDELPDDSQSGVEM